MNFIMVMVALCVSIWHGHEENERRQLLNQQLSSQYLLRYYSLHTCLFKNSCNLIQIFQFLLFSSFSLFSHQESLYKWNFQSIIINSIDITKDDFDRFCHTLEYYNKPITKSTYFEKDFFKEVYSFIFEMKGKSFLGIKWIRILQSFRYFSTNFFKW